MADFPRTIVPNRVTAPRLGGVFRSVSHTGKVQLRAHNMMARYWEETWLMLKASDADVQALLAFLEEAFNRGTFFNIDWRIAPGSGLDPNGLGTSGVTVKGASQTGTSLVTTGWPASTTNVARAGDVIKVAGFNIPHKVVADANSDLNGDATLSIVPSIISGASPADLAAVTTTGVKTRAYVTEFDPPRSRHIDYYGDLTIRFGEAP